MSEVIDFPLAWPKPLPIERAPKDGRWIIGWRRDMLPAPIKWHNPAPWLQPAAWWGMANPTHWLPFPSESVFDPELLAEDAQ